MNDRPKLGPVDHVNARETLETHVVSTDNGDVRVHGFSLCNDLIPNYSFAEYIFTCITGHPPDREQGRAFEVTLGFLAPIEPVDAPMHAAILAQVCQNSTSTIASIAAVASNEALTPIHQGDVETYVATLPDSYRDTVANCDTIETALRAVLDRCGVDVDRWLPALTLIARLPLILAEALVHRVHRDYPLHDAPPFEYGHSVDD